MPIYSDVAIDYTKPIQRKGHCNVGITGCYVATLEELENETRR